MQTDQTEEPIVPKLKPKSLKEIQSIEKIIANPFSDDENNCILLEEHEENLITA